MLSSCATLDSIFTEKPSIPILSFPLDGSAGVTVLPVFSWSGSGAEHFYMYLGKEPVLNSQHLVARREKWLYESTKLDFGATYYWKVDAVNSGGISSSKTFSFTTTTDESAFLPPEPFNLSVDAVGTEWGYRCVFSWTRVAATQYDFYFGTGEDPRLYASNLSVSEITVADCAPRTTYFWKVVARNEFGERSSAVREYTTGDLPASEPVGVYPEANADGVPLNVRFIWTESICPLGSQIEYELLLSERADFLICDRFERNAQPFRDVTGLTPSTTYYWKVIGHSYYGSVESETLQFTTRSFSLDERPETPYGPLPTNGSETSITAVTLSWNSERADHYSLYLGLTEDDLPLEAEGLTDTLYPLTDLAPDTVYYWQIIATNAAGSTEGPIWRFRTGKADTVAPEVSSITLTMSGIPDRRIPLGNVANLRAAISATDDVKLNSAEVILYGKKIGESEWRLIETKSISLKKYQTDAYWNSDFQIRTTPAAFFNSVGSYIVRVSVKVEDAAGNQSSEEISRNFDFEVFKEAAVIPDIEGSWTGTFSIAYIINLNDTISLNIVKTGANSFSVTVVYQGKNYGGAGTIDSNGDLRITAIVEGVNVVLIGSFASATTVDGSIFVLRKDQSLTQVGYWSAQKL